MQSSSLSVAVAASLFLCACAPMTHTVVPEPSKITLQDAMLSVADSFAAMRVKTENERIGVIPCEVNVTFKIGATASDTHTLGVDLSRTISTPPITSVISPSYGYEGAAGGNRSNEVTVKLVHIACLKNDVLVASGKGDFDDARLKLEKGGYLLDQKLSPEIRERMKELFKKNPGGG